MKKYLAAGVTVAATLAILAACGDDDSTGGGGVALDGGGLSLEASVSDAAADACSGCSELSASIAGLRWSLPCTSDVGGTACAATDPATQTVTLAGATGATYDVTLRFRGVVELETYTVSGDGGTLGATGTNASFFAAVAQPANDGNNVYRLDISSPQLTAYLNSGTHVPYCFPIDYSVTVPMRTGASISLGASAVDGVQVKNVDANGQPIIVPEIAPAPAAFNGQFVQMDVVTVTKQP